MLVKLSQRRPVVQRPAVERRWVYLAPEAGPLVIGGE